MSELFFISIIFLIPQISKAVVYQCTGCDNQTTVPVQACTFEVNDMSINSSSCACIDNTHLWKINNETNIISCYDPHEGECVDTTPQDDVCDNKQNIRCTTTILDSSKNNIAKYLFYFSTVWIISWCFITAVVNIVHKNTGHHRFIHFYEELIIILLFIVIGALSVVMKSNKKICKIVPILSQFFMALLNATFLMEANFAKSMVHGNSKKNGSMPAVLNYILPIPIALIPTLVTYFTLHEYYESSYQFCFSTAPGNMFWAFVIPNWMLIAIAGLQAQLSCLACDMTTPEQDQKQCFWAKLDYIIPAKSLLLFSLLLFTVWYLILSAGNEQILFLFLLAVLLTLFTGPAIFIVHTYCHLNTCQKWGKPSCCGNFYKMCPEKPKEEMKKKDPLDNDDDDPAPQEPAPTKQEPSPPIPNKTAPNPEDPTDLPKKENNVQPVHTASSQFYSWLTAQDMNTRRPSSVLFRPKLA